MKNKNLIFLIFYLPFLAFAQKKDYIRTNNTNQIIVDANLKISKSLLIPRSSGVTLNDAPDSAGYVRYNNTTNKFQGYYGTIDKWKDIGGTPNYIVGSQITSIPAIGDTTSSLQGLINRFYQTQPPLVTFTPSSTILELTGATTGTANINYTYSKQIVGGQPATTDFTSLQFISSQGGQSTVGATAAGGSGVYIASFPSNTSTTFTFRANTTDKFATATASFAYFPRRYWGRTANTFPTQAEILAAAGGGNELNANGNSKLKSNIVITASGSNRPFFAYINTAGAALKILDVNGFDVTSDFRQDTQTFTNVLGNTFTIRTLTLNSATAGNYTLSVTQ